MPRKDFPVEFKLRAVDNISKTLNRVNSNTKTLTGSTRRLSNSFAMAQERTRRFRSSLSKMGGAVKRAGSFMNTRMTLPILGAGAAVIKTAADFESSMNKVQALTRATGEEFQSMRDLAKELGSSTKFSASEAADAMGFLGMAGFKTKEILQATPGLLNLAAASNIELARAADIASNVMGAFNIDASETGRVADVLSAVTASANVDMEMIAETMKFAGPVAKQFGASLEDTAAAAGLLGNLGIQGTNAGTALKNAFLGLAAPTSTAAKMLKQAGVAVTTPAGNMRRFADIMADLGGKLGDLPQKARLTILKELFGKIGIAGGAALQEFGRTGELKKFSEAMKDVDGNAERMATTMNKGAKGGMIAFKSALEGLAIEIGDSGLLGQFTRVIGKVTEWTRSLSQTDKKVLATAVMVAGFAAALGPVLSVIGSVITIMPALISGFALLKVGVLAAVGAFSAAALPIMAIVGGIALVGAGAYLIYKNWEPITKWFSETWDKINGKISTFVNYLKDSRVGKFVGKLFSWTPDFMKRREQTDLEKRRFGALQTGPEALAAPPVAGPVRERKESVVKVDFSNVPSGTKFKVDRGDQDLINVNTGLQAGLIGGY